MSEVPQDVRELAERRADARAAKDFARADALREAIAEAGWTVVDEPGGWSLVPAATTTTEAQPLRAHDVPSVLGEPATADISLHWVCEGWPEDIAAGGRVVPCPRGERDTRYVVADVTGADPGAFGDDVEVLTLEPGTGWAAARNAGLRRTTGRLALVLDGSIEATGDVCSPLEGARRPRRRASSDPSASSRTTSASSRQAPGPGEADAIEGYAMAMRRELLTEVGLFDEKFRWYRTADIEYSFRVKDAGLRTVVVPVPVIKHEHRMWFETDPAERARWSKRNYYRFLDRWRDRWDLVLDPSPPTN